MNNMWLSSYDNIILLDYIIYFRHIKYPEYIIKYPRFVYNIFYKNNLLNKFGSFTFLNRDEILNTIVPNLVSRQFIDAGLENITYYNPNDFEVRIIRRPEN